MLTHSCPLNHFKTLPAKFSSFHDATKVPVVDLSHCKVFMCISLSFHMNCLKAGAVSPVSLHSQQIDGSQFLNVTP